MIIKISSPALLFELFIFVQVSDNNCDGGPIFTRICLLSCILARGVTISPIFYRSKCFTLKYTLYLRFLRVLEKYFHQ